MRARELLLGLIVLIWTGAAQADKERIEARSRSAHIQVPYRAACSLARVCSKAWLVEICLVACT